MEETAFEYIEAQLLTPDDFARQGGVWLLRFGRNIAKPHYASGPRALPHYAVHLIMAGRAELQHGSGSYELARGDAFCLYPGAIYRLRHVQGEEALSMCWFSCDGPQAQTLLNRAGFSESAPVRRQVVTPELSRAAHALFTAPTDGIRGYLRLQAILYELFRRLITAEPPERGDSPHWIADSIAFMTAHYSEGIGVQDVADRLSLHRAYFSKVFTREVGIPPKKYLEKLRMEQALVLLRSTAYTIEEIALTLGYADPYTFAHAFRRYYGMPPGRWRKSAAAGSPEPMEPDQPDKMTKPGDR